MANKQVVVDLFLSKNNWCLSEKSCKMSDQFLKSSSIFYTCMCGIFKNVKWQSKVSKITAEMMSMEIVVRENVLHAEQTLTKEKPHHEC